MALGPGSTDYIVDLWISAAEDRHDGVLQGLDEVGSALATEWEDDPNVLVKALLDTK